ncbi:MAG: hypothetical protein ABDH28_06210 [Brevinematia bacterium]
MRKGLVLIFLVLCVNISFAGVKPFVEAYFSTSLFQNVDDKYLREHYGPYKYGQQYGDNRIYLRDSRLSFIFGLGVKEEGLFGSVDFYGNSFLDGSTLLDINSAEVGYSDDVFTVKGFFKSRSIKMRNLPSEVFFNFLPSLQMFSSTFGRAHWFVPYFLYPVEFLDGSVEAFSTADEDVTNLVLGGRDYYGIYASYFDGVFDVEGYFSKNIYDSIGNLENASSLSNLMTGNYSGARLGVAGNLGIGDLYIGAAYKQMTTNTLAPYVKESDYRYSLFLTVASGANTGLSNTCIVSLPAMLIGEYSSYSLLGGYLAFDMTEFLYVNVEGGLFMKTTYIGTNKVEGRDIYAVGGLVFKGVEGLKVEISGVGLLTENKSNLSILGGDLKTMSYYYISLFSPEDEVKTLAKVGVRNMEVLEPRHIATSIVGVGNVGYKAESILVDILGYANNTVVYNSSVALATNLLYSDLRLYVGYNLVSLLDKKIRKEVGDDLWIKVGGRGVVQVGNVNVGNVGENTTITPYVGLWYRIPKVDSYIVLSYGWYGAMDVNDLDLGRGLESVLIMYNGGRDWSRGLVVSDNMGSTLYSDGRYINTGEYKLSVEPVIRFDLYIRY